MNIHFLLGVPVMGEMSPETVKTKITTCEVCERWDIQYSDITFIFDRWNGEDFISGGGEQFISQRLKDKLEEKKIKGFKTTPVNVKFSKQRGGVIRIGKGAYQDELPAFYHFQVIGKAEAALDDWYMILDPTECEGCKANNKMMTIEASKSRANPELTGKDIDNPLPINVYTATWKHNDIFLVSPTFKILTENFVDTLQELEIKINQKGGVWLRQTNWIE